MTTKINENCRAMREQRRNSCDRTDECAAEVDDFACELTAAVVLCGGYAAHWIHSLSSSPNSRQHVSQENRRRRASR